MIEYVEYIGYRFQVETFSNWERPAKTGVNVKEVKAFSSIPTDHRGDIVSASRSVSRQSHARSARCRLNVRRTRHNVEGQRRVVGQYPAELKPVTDALPNGMCRVHRRMDRRTEYEAMPLIVVGASPVLVDIEIVEW